MTGPRVIVYVMVRVIVYIVPFVVMLINGSEDDTAVRCVKTDLWTNHDKLKMAEANTKRSMMKVKLLLNQLSYSL